MTTDFGANDGATAVAIQGDGKIVVAGFSGVDIAVARYLAEAPRPTFTSFQLAADTVRLTVTNLTPSTSNRFERSLDLASNDWQKLPWFRSTATGTNWSEAASSSWKRVFYRLTQQVP